VIFPMAMMLTLGEGHLTLDRQMDVWPLGPGKTAGLRDLLHRVITRFLFRPHTCSFHP
jgi:hypothetical protein